ncbi:MAG TPA: Hsp20/alpha crystallin family protein [Methylomirabilota bacterium]|nr:Hsp20/alpha crystallin family protein [Methylomirabilota bacterium]
MSALTKWNPFRTSSEIEEWGPLARWSPFREMERMQREMDRLFNGGLVPAAGGKEAMTLTEWAPRVDITEDDKEFVVKAELPEVKKEDVKVTVEDDVLTFRGERKAEKDEKGKKYHRIERSYGSFERSFTVPEGSDAGKISSEFKDGVLIVHLPKNPNAKRKAIEIKVQ